MSPSDWTQLILAVLCAVGASLLVAVETALQQEGINDPELVRGALTQVAPGVLRAYAEDDLGPFAREIVAKIRETESAKPR